MLLKFKYKTYFFHRKMGFTVFSEYLALNQLINKLNYNIAYQGMFEIYFITDYRLRTIWYIYLIVFSLLIPTKTLTIFSTVYYSV